MKPTAAQQLYALGNLKASDMSREDMVDAAMFRRRVKIDGEASLNDKEVERVAAIYLRYFN
mgnify:FL=1